MRVNKPMLPAVTMADIGVAVKKKELDQTKQQGKAAVDLINKATENLPIPDDQLGNKINIKI